MDPHELSDDQVSLMFISNSFGYMVRLTVLFLLFITFRFSQIEEMVSLCLARSWALLTLPLRGRLYGKTVTRNGLRSWGEEFVN